MPTRKGNEAKLAAIILAAGLGTRMRSERAKVLHELAGEPMIAPPIRVTAALGARPIIVVVGYQAGEVEAAARRSCPDSDLAFAKQNEQRGTGDAARCAVERLPANFHGRVMIINGDMPASL